MYRWVIVYIREGSILKTKGSKRMTKKKFCDCIYTYKKDFYIIASAILKNSANEEDAVSNAICKRIRTVTGRKFW